MIPPEPPDFRGLSFISSLLRSKPVLLLTETHPTWDGREGKEREQCPCQGGFLGMQVPGLSGMKLLMKQSLPQADINQMCEQRIAVFRAKCSPSTPEQNQSLFPHMELEGHL